jgi:hypothetical protein
MKEGQPDQALDLLEEMLKVPYLLAPGWLTIGRLHETSYKNGVGIRNSSGW